MKFVEIQDKDLASLKADSLTTAQVKEVAVNNSIETVDLPSQFIFYNFDQLNFRKFQFREFAQLAAAQRSNSFQSLAEAVAQTILNYDGRLLTADDFQYVMYLHRLTMSEPWSVEWYCDAPKHLEWVEKGKPVFDPNDPDKEIERQPCSQDTLRRHNEIKQTALVVKHPDQAALEKLLSKDGQLFDGVFVYPVTLLDQIALENEKDEIIDAGVKQDRPLAETEKLLSELEFTNTYASLLSPFKHGVSLAERRKFFEDWLAQQSDHYAVLKRFDEFLAASDHSVKETVKLTCGECGTEKEIDISFSVAQFFPAVPARPFA